MGNFNGNVNGSDIDESLVNKGKKKKEFDEKIYLDTKLKDGEDERNITIRILPVSDEDGNFRVAIKAHNFKLSKRIAKSGFKSFICLNEKQLPNYDQNIKCPICEKSNEYFEEAKKCRESDPERSKALFKKGASMKAKTVYIVRVIERGKESDGVKFWRFNENTKGDGCYDKLIALYKQRKEEMAEEGIDNYNIFDLDNGRDIVLTLKRTVRADGQENTTILINDKSISKPLTKNIEEGNAWISDTKRWYDAYTARSKEYLQIIAEDKIPYYDENEGKLVAKTEADFLNKDNGKNTTNNDSKSSDDSQQYKMPNVETTEEDDTDLPF